MKLSDAACYFDRTEVRDVTTGALLFHCQIDPFDDARRDSSTSYRRIMSVRPGTVMPVSRVAQAMNYKWLIGSMEPDGLAELHREKYVVQHATDQLKISRLSGYLSGTVTSTVWSAQTWVKDDKQLVVSSMAPQIYDVTLPDPTDVRVQDVMWSPSGVFLVLAVHPQASGFINAHCVKLDQVGPVSASLTTRTYVPTTGTYTSNTPTTVNSLKVPWQHLFEYGSQMSERYQEGDCAMVLPTGTVVTTASILTQSGVTWQVLAVLSLGAAVVLHARVT